MIKSILKISFPAMISMVFNMLIELINTVFVGHLNDPYKLAGVGIGNMTVNIIAMSIIYGLNSALETFIS